MEQAGSSSRLARNMKERDRRKNFNLLLAELAKLIHPQPLTLPAPQLVDYATDYVKQLRTRIENLKRQKVLHKKFSREDFRSARLPKIDLKSWASLLEVNMICALDKKIMLHDIVRVLQEEGAEVTSFMYHDAGDNVIYNIKSQAVVPRIGIETSRVYERLKDLAS